MPTDRVQERERQPDRATALRIVERGRRVRAERGGRLPAGWIRTHAEILGVADSTLLRLLRDGVAPSRPSRRAWRWEDKDDRAIFYRATGQVDFARQLMLKKTPGRALPTLRTMQRAVQLDFSPAEIARARVGEAAARERRISISFDAPHRNAVWIADHSQIPIQTEPLRGHRPAEPWMTLVQDDATRRILGGSLHLSVPARTQILATLGSAITTAGVPREVQFDRGRDFLSGVVREAALHVGFVSMPVEPYSPHLKGKLERLNGTIQRWTGQELGIAIKPARTIRNTPLLGDTPVFEFAEVSKAFFAAIDHHNQQHRKRALGRRTPNQAYRADPTPEEHVDLKLLDRFMLIGAQRKVSSDGVTLDGQPYVCPEIVDQVGVRVEVRYRQDDRRTVRLFRKRDDGQTVYWCTAVARDTTDHDQSVQLTRVRADTTKPGSRDIAHAKRAQKRSYRSVIEPGDATDTTLHRGSDYRDEVGTDHAALNDVVADLGLPTDV